MGMEQLAPSLVFYLLVLVLCLTRPKAGRVFVGIFFLIMALGVNVVVALLSPELFVGLGADAPLVPAYQWFFENVVASAPLLFGLLAAAYEITIALIILFRGRYAKWGLIGGIVFLIWTTPFGVWTLANPVLALALAVLLGREYDGPDVDGMVRRAGRRRRFRELAAARLLRCRAADPRACDAFSGRMAQVSGPCSETARIDIASQVEKRLSIAEPSKSPIAKASPQRRKTVPAAKTACRDRRVQTLGRVRPSRERNTGLRTRLYERRSISATSLVSLAHATPLRQR